MAIECVEALIRGENPDESDDASAAVAYIVGSIEHIKKRLDNLAGVKE